MSVKIVSFDAAQTLVDVDWSPGRFAVGVAKARGLDLDPEFSIGQYEHLVASRWGEYCRINAERDRAAGDAFWNDLTTDWLAAIGHAHEDAHALAEFGRRRMLSREHGCFRAYPEVAEALDALRDEGYRLIVLSNWDYTLERTLEALGLRSRFDAVFASLEMGVEKPEPVLFRLVEGAMGEPAEAFLHVGDNPVDDYQGARNAGWRAALVDRSIAEPTPPRIPDLLHVREAIGWTR